MNENRHELDDVTLDDMTRLVGAARDGDASAQSALIEQIYEELKSLARSTPGVGRRGETFQATALTNEVLVRLCRRFPPPPQSMPENRRTFFRSLALAMRTIVRDHARHKQVAARYRNAKQGNISHKVATEGYSELGNVDALALDAALSDLESYSQPWYDVVLHRYFAGQSIAETAEQLGIAESTVSVHWSYAKAWLARRLCSEVERAK